MVSIARVYGPVVATKLDKFKNLHSSDTIDTQQLGARGESIWIQSEDIMQSVVRTRTPEEIEAMLEEERNERPREKQADTES